MNSCANQLGFQQLLEPNESGVHLAEGAGDTLPTDSEIDANEQNRLDYLSEYYDSSLNLTLAKIRLFLDSEDSFDGSEDLDEWRFRFWIRHWWFGTRRSNQNVESLK